MTVIGFTISIRVDTNAIHYFYISPQYSMKNIDKKIVYRVLNFQFRQPESNALNGILFFHGYIQYIAKTHHVRY